MRAAPLWDTEKQSFVGKKPETHHKLDFMAFLLCLLLSHTKIVVFIVGTIETVFFTGSFSIVKNPGYETAECETIFLVYSFQGLFLIFVAVQVQVKHVLH